MLSRRYDLAPKHLIFATGNHFWLYSRHSIGIQVIDRFAKFLNYRWIYNKDILCSYIETKRFIFVKPKTYNVADNGRALKFIQFYYPNNTVDNLTVIHHDVNLPVGVFQTGFSSKIKGNLGLESIFDCLKSDSFRKMSIGVGNPEELRFVVPLPMHRTDAPMRSLFSYNKIPDSHQELIENNLFGENLEYTLKCLLNRKRNVRSDKDINNPRNAHIFDQLLEEKKIEQEQKEKHEAMLQALRSR
jgi:peptidyl-tRNA hydrolase